MIYYKHCLDLHEQNHNDSISYVTKKKKKKKNAKREK